ncbi:MAG: hypothetical protein SynsKO_16230 [Synoicihabitans sp.]
MTRSIRFPFPALPSFLLRVWVLGCVALGTCASAQSDWKIAVNASPFPSAELAAVAESTVDWDDANSLAATACTLAYAAVELQQHLRLMVADPPALAFEIVSLESAPSAAPTITLTTLAEAAQFPFLNALARRHDLSQKLTAKGSFAILPHDTGIAIMGAERTGTLYGAYALLEHWGVRWYGPEPHERHLPKLAKLAPPLEPVFSAPDFATRGFWVREDKGNIPFYRWMARNRLNFWSIAEPNRAFLHKLGMHLTFGGHHYWEKYLDPTADYPFDHPKFAGDDHLPLDPYPAAAEFLPEDHNGDGRLSFQEARPEWYGLDEQGVRTPFEGMYGMNVCSSNPAPLDYLYSKIVDEVAHGEWQDVASLNFWSIDNGVWCECPDCVALGEPTDRLLLMVHGLDQAIDAARQQDVIKRPLKIVFPIYQQSLAAPTRPLPDDFDYGTNVGTFFPILRCYVHLIDDPNCTEYNTEHWDAFRGWTEAEDRHYRGEIFVGEYFNVSVNKSLPVIYPRIIREDVAKFHAAGARHMHYMHTDTRLLGVKRINNYLFARALWNTATDFADREDEYFAHLYGEVAQDMREVYRELEFALSNIRQFRYWHHLPERIIERTFPLFHKSHFQLERSTSSQDDGVDLSETLDAFRRLRERLDRVLARPVSPEIQTRLAIDVQTIRYGENTVFFYDAVARAMIAERTGDIKRAQAQFERSLPFARALQAETEVVKTATNHHVHARDGLHATRIEEAYLELGKRLNPDFEW